MLALIRKEFISIYNWTFIFFISVFSFILVSGQIEPIVILTTLTFFIAFKNFENDRKVNMDVVLNSLPVSRLQILIAKYITFYLYLLLAFIFFVFLAKVSVYFSTTSIFQKVDFDIKLLLATLVIWSIYMAMYIPISFLIKAQVIQYICLFIFMFAIPFVFNVIEVTSPPNEFLMQLDPVSLSLAIAATLVINVISCLFLYSIYRKKDLL